MSVHIEAKPGEIADKILLPGDPLRAKYIAETFLENPVCYNQVRGMLGYTGTYKGQRVSVQGTGMGMPSAGIYAHELINSYNVKKLIRVGTCGSISEKVNVRELSHKQQRHLLPRFAMIFLNMIFHKLRALIFYSNLTKLLKQKALLPMLVTYCQMMFFTKIA